MLSFTFLRFAVAQPNAFYIIRILIIIRRKKMYLFQFGNTCYSNSVLQALYFCKPFREKVLEYKAKNKRTKETLLTCLADLFYSIATQKKKVGSIAPKKFIARLRKEKGRNMFGCLVWNLLEKNG